MPIDPDATVELRPPGRNGDGGRSLGNGEGGASSARSASPPAKDGEGRRSGTTRLAALGVAGTALVAAGAAALWWHAARDSGTPARGTPAQDGVAAVATPAAAPPAAAVAPHAADPAGPPTLAEAEILAHRAAGPALLRLHANPRVFVIDFPDLATQGAALNRVAALVEKAGLPRDRVLADGELAEAIARAGDTPETYYFGHNYRADDLARFFALAARDGVALNPAEAWVRAHLALARRLVPEGDLALVSISAPGPRVDAAMRAAFLRHEIGHGHYFTLPAYAAHVRRVWRELFTPEERATFRRFLAAEGYDAEDEELVINEAQAYLIHTPDPHLFAPAMSG